MTRVEALEKALRPFLGLLDSVGADWPDDAYLEVEDVGFRIKVGWLRAAAAAIAIQVDPPSNDYAIAEAARSVVESSAIEFDDLRLSYVTLQVDLHDWASLRAAVLGGAVPSGKADGE